MRTLDRTLFTVLSQILAAGLIACQVAEAPEDDYRNLPSLSTDSCVADCEDGEGSGGTPDIPGGDVCDYRTQTQGGWGTSCNGDNPGCFRDAHFAQEFPGGLELGCGTKKAILKTSKAVEKALPAGGKPRALLASELTYYYGKLSDPDPKTVLFGQAVALTLNIRFDTLPGYNPLDPTIPLGDLVIADPGSPCVGMTVYEVLAEVNDILGGCGSSLTPSQANMCATKINEAFVDGGKSCNADFVPPNDPIPG